MRKFMRCVILLITSVLFSHALAAADLSVNLHISNSPVKFGVAPQFVVEVKNISSAPKKILDVRQRSALKDSYAQVLVTFLGKEVDVPSTISDPGVINEGDWLTLAPGEAISFESVGEPDSLENLPIGNYQAKVKFSASENYDVIKSHTITFRVVK